MKCRICPRCGGNHFEREGHGYKCAYCDTVFVEDPAITAGEGYFNFDDIEDENVRAEIFADTRSQRLDTADLMIRDALLPYALSPVGLFVFLFGVSCIPRPNDVLAGIGIILAGLGIIGLSIFLALRKRKQLIGAIKTKKDIENSIMIHD